MPVCPSCGKENPEGFQFCGFCSAPLTAQLPREQRKTVTVLFCDVTGSTQLGESTDPEALRALLARYFERMKGIVEAHGGTVEKFIGDAVMAVFGVPQVHEDDALRACRAAVEMREALPELGLQARIGLNTGEVVTGTEERLATGDAVNVAARLEQAAQPAEILIGDGTLALVRDAVETEPVEPLQLKGKARPVAAFRLDAVRKVTERRHGPRFVGRKRELETLHQAWQRAKNEECCQLLTIAGDPGVGKSRLVAEFLAASDARVIHGRCLSYGEGITYFPVVEVLKQLATLPADPAAAASLRSLLGETQEATSADEIAWAFRKLLEEQAPLVCVFDDIQWGEETFLDLLEHVALLSTGASILLLCLARPELAEHRPQWSIALRLEPLPGAEVDALIPATVSDELKGKITRVAGGNPLFVTEMVAMAREAGGEVAVPPNLKALLAARLDALEQPERSVLERGAIEGELFHRTAVQALSSDGQVAPRLTALVRKELLRPDTPQLAGDDAFRFRHLLIRDAAYDALPKAIRAELHERFAAWLEERATDLFELDEMLGHHLEQAAKYKQELGQRDAKLVVRAAEQLAKAGRRALDRDDPGAAVQLLDRAAKLFAEDDPRRPPLLVEQGWSHWDRGELNQAVAHFRSAGASVGDSDEATALASAVGELYFRIQTEPESPLRKFLDRTQGIIRRYEVLGDTLGLARAWELAIALNWMDLRAADTAEAAERALSYAHAAGNRRLVRLDTYWLAKALYYGPVQVDTVAARVEQLLAENRDQPILDAQLASVLGGLEAMRGDFTSARQLTRRASDVLTDLGATFVSAQLALIWSDVELLAGAAESAVEILTRSLDALETMGERPYLATRAAQLAQALYALERYGDATQAATRGAEAATSDDLSAWVDIHAVRAKLAAHAGDDDRAVAEAGLARSLVERTDDPNFQGRVELDLAEALAAAGDRETALRAVERAVTLFQAKGNVVLAREAAARRDALAS